MGISDLSDIYQPPWTRRKLMKLGPERTGRGVNYRRSECEPSPGAVGELFRIERPWHLPRGASMAGDAALLARAGHDGPGSDFEGQMGFEKELGLSLGGKVAEVFDTAKSDSERDG